MNTMAVTRIMCSICVHTIVKQFIVYKFNGSYNSWSVITFLIVIVKQFMIYT